MATFELLAAAIARTLRPLTFAMRSEDGIRSLVEEVGWTLPTIPQSLKALSKGLLQLHTSLADLTVAEFRADLGNGNTSEIDTALANLASDLAFVVEQLHTLPTHLRAELPANFITATHIDEELENRVFDWLLSIDLTQNAVILYRLLCVMGVIEVVEKAADPVQFQPAFKHYRIHWDRLLRITDPASLAREVYGWGTPEIDSRRLFAELVPLSFALGMPAEFRYATVEFTAKTAPGANVDLQPLPQLWLPVFRSDNFTFFVVATVLVKTSPDELQGLVLALVPSASSELPIPIGDDLELAINATAQVGTGAALILRPDHPPDVVLDMDGAAGSTLTSGRILATMAWRSAEEETPEGISASGGTQLTARSVSIGLGAEATGESLNIFARLEIDQGKLVITAPKEDGFLSNILPENGLTASFSFILLWDQEGLHFQGSAGLTTSIPLNKILGPLHLQLLELSLELDEESLASKTGVTAAIKMGPLMMEIQNVGLTGIIRTVSGNLGPVDVNIGFKPPSAIGLVVDASIVKGGGFLHIDEDRGEYFGTLELKIGSINIKAIVILSTKMPDGSPGWSLLMLIYSQFPPIQLSWGFTLNGVGGLIGVQHGMHIEELKSGMRTGALDDVLFPENPVVDAPRIINRLRVIFPATPRALVVGPMLELGWSTPTIMKIRMGLLFQIDNVFGGDRPASIKRIILLGQLLIQLPPEVGEEAVLLKLLVDFYGYYDFDINRLEFAARLRDSHVMKLPLSGMLFLRAEFGEKPTFILSAGGFHPNFKDLPADIPSPIDRLEIKFNIDIVEIRAQKYFAVTAASVQTGASIEVNASVGPVDISGWLGYDAIFYFKPRFFFEVDIRAGVLVKYRGHRLGGITLKLHLEGPGKWRARGSVTFSIFWWDIEKGFDVSWGKDPEIEQIKTKVSLLMEEALTDKANWRAQLPQGGESVVTLQIAADETAVLAHPLGQLQVSQRVAPLDLELQHFGNTEVDGASKFSVTNLTVSGHQFTNEPALEFFARSHFVDMSDEEKLTSPSFEKFSSGVTVGSADFSAPGEVINADLEFETKYIDLTNPVPRSVDAGKVPLGISKTAFMAQMQHGAAAKSAMRSTAPLRPGTPRKIKLSEPGLQVASTDTQASAVDLQGLSRVTSALAEQEARKVLGKDSLRLTHMVVEEYELTQ